MFHFFEFELEFHVFCLQFHLFCFFLFEAEHVVVGGWGSWSLGCLFDGCFYERQYVVYGLMYVGDHVTRFAWLGGQAVTLLS